MLQLWFFCWDQPQCAPALSKLQLNISTVSPGARWVRGGRFVCLQPFFLVMAAARPFNHMSSPITGLSLNVYQPLRSKCCLPSLPGMLSEGFTLTLHYISWGHNESRTVSVAPVFILFPCLLSLSTSTCPPLDVSMCGSLRCVYVLTLESFVELQFNCYYLKGRNLQVVSLCYNADITPVFLFLIHR